MKGPIVKYEKREFETDDFYSVIRPSFLLMNFCLTTLKFLFIVTLPVIFFSAAEH